MFFEVLALYWLCDDLVQCPMFTLTVSELRLEERYMRAEGRKKSDWCTADAGGLSKWRYLLPMPLPAAMNMIALTVTRLPLATMTTSIL